MLKYRSKMVLEAAKILSVKLPDTFSDDYIQAFIEYDKIINVRNSYDNREWCIPDNMLIRYSDGYIMFDTQDHFFNKFELVK